MFGRVRPLGLVDIPLRQQRDNAFLIRSKVPAGYVVQKTPLAEGAHNAVFVATHPGIDEQVLFRINTNVPETKKEQRALEREIASEVARSIEFAILGIAPLIYDYGYCPSTETRDGYYWQVLEMFDESLHAYLLRRGARACAEVHRVEELVLHKLALMVQAGSFCYDIHPRNVVIRVDGVPGHIAQVALIDFDDSFCIHKSRIELESRQQRPGSKRRQVHDHGLSLRHGVSGTSETRRRKGGRHSRKPGRPTYHMNANNLLVCALIVFGSNSKEQCGVPLFRDKVLGLLHGDAKYAIVGGGPVSMRRVLEFLGNSTAQGDDSVLDILRHWNPTYGDQATPQQFVDHVLGPIHGRADR